MLDKQIKHIDIILFPSDFFDLNKVDEELKEEYEVVEKTALFETLLFGYDPWFNEKKLVIKKKFDEKKVALYRGWMMRPDQYEKFYGSLLKNNIQLITDPNSYSLMHAFPHVYEKVKEDTARMEIYPLHFSIDIEAVKRHFNRFMVKDYVKSVKGSLFPSYFDQRITQQEFEHWMDIFYEFRGDLLTGGICIKEYFDLKRYNGQTNEYRVFYMNNEIVSVAANSNQDNTPSVSRELVEKYKTLESPFYTIDYAELEDGSWKVIESGDGGVSGLPDTLNPNEFYRRIYELQA